MKIAYIIEGLFNSGGMERVVSYKANWLATNSTHEITIITFSQNDRSDFFPLHKNIIRINWELDSHDVSNDLEKKLRIWLKEHPQDICISTYGREFKILPKIKDGSKKIVEFHFAYDINKHWLSNSSNKLRTAVLGHLKTRAMTLTAKKYDCIVCLTEADKKRWNSDKVVQIYNPITIEASLLSDCSSKEIVAVGRMDKQKGFDYLLDCWKTIEHKHPDWQLKIYGGGDSSIYEKQIKDLGLKHASLRGRTSDVPKVLRESSIYILSSRYEGFPLIICEAMRCGLPIVSFDCPSGPAELVKDGVNGYVIKKVGDIDKMSKCISDLIENEDLRKKFGQNSHQLSKKLESTYIMEKWLALFAELKEQTN